MWNADEGKDRKGETASDPGLLKVQPPAWQHQQPLGIGRKCKRPGPTPDLRLTDSETLDVGPMVTVNRLKPKSQWRNQTAWSSTLSTDHNNESVQVFHMIPSLITSQLQGQKSGGEEDRRRTLSGVTRRHPVPRGQCPARVPGSGSQPRNSPTGNKTTVALSPETQTRVS